MTTRILDVNSAVRLPDETAAAETARERLWMSTLNALSAYQMYRLHVGVHVSGPEVMRFLLADPHFPRSVSHCLGEIENCLCDLVNYEEPLKVARHAWKRLDGARLDDLTADNLHDRLDQMQGDLAELHTAISRQYFHLHQHSALPEQTLSQ